MNFQPYLDQLRASGWSPETVKAYRADLTLLVRYLVRRKLKLTQVTHAVIEEFVDHMKTQDNPRFGRSGLKQTTIDRRLAAISGWFNFLAATSNPRLRNPTKSPIPKKRAQYKCDRRRSAIPEPILSALLSGVLNVRDRAFLLLLVSSGLRLSEACRLDVKDIDEVKETRPGKPERIWGTGWVMGKGGKERRFYFDDETVVAIRGYLETRSDMEPALFLSSRKTRLSSRGAEQMLTSLCRKLKLPHLHPHQCRATFATRLANASLDPMVLQALMGHEDFQTTLLYAEIEEETKARQYFAAMEVIKGK